MRKPIIISVVNHKGGCLKTTLTVNLAAALARAGKKVLAIDLDAQQNLTASLIGPITSGHGPTLFDVAAEPEVKEEAQAEPPKASRTIEEAAREVKVLLHPESQSEERQVTPRKADIYTERVTLQLSIEMRDALDALAKELQRRRTSKEERITANTVMRVAIKSLLERLELQPGDSVNTEEELLELVSSRPRDSNS